MKAPWTFRNELSSSPSGSAPAGALQLEAIWDVEADASYVVPVPVPRRRCLVAVRTLAGRGRMLLDPGGWTAIEAGTLLVVENQRIRHYNCEGAGWHFWWFEFLVAGVLFFPLHQPLAVAKRRDDAAAFREAFASLRRSDFAQRSLASAGFSLLMHRWLAFGQGRRKRSPHQVAIGRVVDGMHARLDGRWSLVAMAREACLSERRFRQVFAALTGQTPKRFYDGVRLAFGRELLRLGVHKVADVGARLGFSSAFHFSRAFRQRFGVAPSRIAAGEVAPPNKFGGGTRRASVSEGQPVQKVALTPASEPAGSGPMRPAGSRARRSRSAATSGGGPGP